MLSMFCWHPFKKFLLLAVILSFSIDIVMYVCRTSVPYILFHCFFVLQKEDLLITFCITFCDRFSLSGLAGNVLRPAR